MIKNPARMWMCMCMLGPSLTTQIHTHIVQSIYGDDERPLSVVLGRSRSRQSPCSPTAYRPRRQGAGTRPAAKTAQYDRKNESNHCLTSCHLPTPSHSSVSCAGRRSGATERSCTSSNRGWYSLYRPTVRQCWSPRDLDSRACDNGVILI